MNFQEMIVALAGMGFVFGIPLSLVWTYHRRKVLEIQLRLKQDADTSVRSSVDALREEMRNLRDTTMQYDISFDNALQRLEQRVDHLERSRQTTETERVAELRVGQ
jgi:hypothetical protein